jgi:hypothetical protein
MTTLSPKDVVIVDGVRTAMGKSKMVCSAMYALTACLRSLLKPW